MVLSCGFLQAGAPHWVCSATLAALALAIWRKFDNTKSGAILGALLTVRTFSPCVQPAMNEAQRSHRPAVVQLSLTWHAEASGQPDSMPDANLTCCSSAVLAALQVGAPAGGRNICMMLAADCGVKGSPLARDACLGMNASHGVVSKHGLCCAGEMLIVNFLGLWHYTRPDLFGVPHWAGDDQSVWHVTG